MAANSYQWSTERFIWKNVVATESNDPLFNLANQIASLTKKIEAWEQSTRNSVIDVQSPNWAYDRGFCSNLGGYQGGHSSQEGYPYQEIPSYLNFSYENPNNFFQPPPEFSASNGEIDEPRKPGLEEILLKYISGSNARLSTIEMRMMTLEDHISQIADSLSNLHQSGQFPSNTVVDFEEQCIPVKLRSDTTVEGPNMPDQESEVVEIEVEEEEPKPMDECKVPGVLVSGVMKGYLESPKIPIKACISTSLFSSKFSFYLCSSYFDEFALESVPKIIIRKALEHSKEEKETTPKLEFHSLPGHLKNYKKKKKGM